MKRKAAPIRAIILLTLLAAAGIYAAVLAVPAARNMLTPPSERFRQEGDAFLAGNRLPESVLSYRQAVEADPQNIRALVSLSEAYAKQGRARMAERYRALAAELQGQPAPAATLQPDAGPVKRLWIAQPDPSTPAGGVLAGDMLIAAYEDGRLFAIRLADGSTAWQEQLPAPLTSAPAVDGQNVYVGDAAGALHARSLASGSPAWDYATGGPVYAAPLAAGGVVFTPSSGGTLFALSAQDGKLRWKFTTGSPLNSTPVLADGFLFFGCNDGKLYRLDAVSGAPAWPDGIQTNGAIESQPAINDQRLIFGSEDGRVYALDAKTGGRYWRYSTPDAVFAPVLEQDGQVYIASSGGSVSAVNLLSGKQTWQTDLTIPLRSPPALSGQRILQLGEASSDLFVLDRQTGALLYSIPTGDWTAAGPWVEGDRLFLLGKDGAALAYRIP